MFQDISNYQNDSLFGKKQIELYEKILGFRISLQQSLDEVNKFPILSDLELDIQDIKKKRKLESNIPLKDLVRTSIQLLESQITHDTNMKTKSIGEDNFDYDMYWNKILDIQQRLQSDSWEPIVNMWHTRVHFGNEHSKSKLKVFNQTLWDQVHFILYLSMY
jgi:hypothetical protein